MIDLKTATVQEFHDHYYPKCTFKPRGWNWTKLFTKDNEFTTELSEVEDDKNYAPLYYDYSLVYDGARFVLFKGKNHTKEDVAYAKSWLKNTRDAVDFTIANV